MTPRQRIESLLKQVTSEHNPIQNPTLIALAKLVSLLQDERNFVSHTKGLGEIEKCSRCGELDVVFYDAKQVVCIACQVGI